MSTETGERRQILRRIALLREHAARALVRVGQVGLAGNAQAEQRRGEARRVLATISFQNLGFFWLEDAPPDASAEITRVVADLYCERMELAIG
jgi:hypothetical protein